MRTKPRGRDVLDEAAQKLHRGQRHRAPLVAMGVVLPLKVRTSPSKASKRWLLIATRWV
jgi:hypothetical protein